MTLPNVGEDMGKMDLSHITDVNVKLYSHAGKIIRQFLKT